MEGCAAHGKHDVANCSLTQFRTLTVYVTALSSTCIFVQANDARVYDGMNDLHVASLSVKCQL